MNRILTSCRAHPLRLMWCVLLVSMAMHAATMSFSPVHWIDDVLITEFSRNWFSTPDNDWTLVWSPAKAGRGTPGSMAYLGGLMLEYGYRAFGHLGPRALTMGWLLVLTALVVFYISRKTGRAGLSCLCGLLCFTAPCLTQSARGARVDVMAVAFAFVSLCVLQLDARTKMARTMQFSLVGVSVALSAFTWLPGLMLAPLVGWEMLERFRRERSLLGEMVFGLTMAGVAFVGTSLVLLGPFYPNVLETFVGTQRAVARVSNNGAAGWHWIEFVQECVKIPGLFALGFVALFLRKRTWLLALAFVGLALVCISSKVYVFRMIYLWPYALVGAAVFAASLTGRWYVRCCVLLAVMALASWGWSVGLRNVTECFMRDYRDYDKLRADMTREIGCDVKIYMYCDHQYYIGRELGWKMYRHQHVDQARELFDRVDYVLEEEQMLDAEKIGQIMSCGFATNRIICADVRKPANAIERFLVEHGRAHAYGPYRLFVRTRRSTLKGE